MATIYVIGSGSSGNGYILDDGGQKLILELGVPFKETLEAIHYDLTTVVGCLVSHKHTDHAKYVDKALMYRLPVYSCQEVADSHKGVIVLQPNRKYRIGGFVVQPIPVKHNAENYAYLIEHPCFGRLVFATDLCEFPYKIKNINHWLIEANYDDGIVFDRLYNNEVIQSQNENHLSINQCCEVLERNYCVETRTVTLIHLSLENSNSKDFKDKVGKIVGFEPNIACKGLKIELNKELF